MEPGGIYAETRARITELVRGLTPEGIRRRLPATPAWTVKDVVAHLTGIVDDSLAGRLEGAGTDSWTAAQVDARRARTLDEILAEWAVKAPDFEARMGGWRRRAWGQVIADIATHEQDIRGGVGRPGARDSEGFAVAREGSVFMLGARIKNAGLPALGLRADDHEWVAGAGEPAASVRADCFELVRALVGRRSARQIAAFDWEGDRAPYMEVFAFFPKPDFDIVE